MNKEKKSYIEEYLFSEFDVRGLSAEKYYEAFCNIWSKENLKTHSGLQITVDDIESYIEEIRNDFSE